jgi:hypothetical protein
MPFKSKAQARYLFAKEPAVAKKFTADSPSEHPIKDLPEHVSFGDRINTTAAKPWPKKGR